MSDEQTIYISPEDDLTNVRERLERLPSRSVTLVIPRQTLLRSNVAWRNLYARAKELEKDVLIISADAQIRSLAQAAKFRVAHSLESSPTGKSRPPVNRIGRHIGTGRQKNAPSTRAANAKGAPEGRAGNRSRSVEPLDTPYNDRVTPRSSVQNNFPTTSKTTTGGLTGNAPSTFGGGSQQSYGKPYDFRIDETPSIHSLPPQHLDEDTDMLLFEDYHQANSIRDAASQGSAPEATQPMPPSTPRTDIVREQAQAQPTYRITPQVTQSNDPFFMMGDELPPPPMEQQAGVAMDGFDTTEHKIQDATARPTDIIDGEIEYQGDLGEFVPTNTHEPTIATRSWVDELPEDDEDMVGPSRRYGMRPRSSRFGRPQQPQQPQQTTQQPEQLAPSPRPSVRRDSKQLPIEERPTQITPLPLPQQVRASSPQATPPTTGRVPTAGRASQNNAPLRRVPTSPAPTPPGRQTAAQRTAGSRTAGQPARATGTRATGNSARPGTATLTRRQRLREGAVPVAIIVTLLLIVGLLAYLVPSATVTVVVATRDFSAPVKLTASAAQLHNTAVGSVPAVVLSQTFPKTGVAQGTGTATGTTQIGTAKATGTVTFTNTGTTPLDIASNTVITTASGIQFVTTADVVVNIANSNIGNTIQAPIQAQQSGENGNVTAGIINTIPASSVSAIAQANNVNTTAVKLTVNNDAATSGGGLANASTVKQADLDKVKQSLLAGLQNDITAWKKQVVQSGDEAGTPSITGTLINTPTVGQVVDSGTFNASLKATVTLLVVRSADIQAASIQALNATLRGQKDKSLQNYVVVSDAAHPVTVAPIQVKGDANTLTLTFTAKGKIAPNLSASNIQHLVLSKSKSDARTLVRTLPGVQDASVDTFPGFVNWVTPFTPRVTVQFTPGSSK